MQLLILATWVTFFASDALAQTDPALKTLADRYWEAWLERHPTRATEIGDHRYNDRLDDLSERGRERWKGTLQQLLLEVRRLPREALHDDDAFTRDLLERAMEDELSFGECALHQLSVEPLSGPHLQLPLLLVSQPFRNADDFRAYVARLRAFPAQIDDVIVNLRAGMARGFVSPKIVVQKVRPQLRAQIVNDVSQSELFKPIRIADTLSDDDRAGVTRDIQGAIASAVVPAHRKLLEFIEQDYLPACRDTVGIGAVPGGDKVYGSLIALHTTSRISAHEVHALGLEEVGRIRGETEQLRKSVAFEGTLDQFLAHMRSDPKHRFTSGPELFAAADAILQRAKPQMSKLFGRLPRADCVMKEIERFRASAAPVAYYNPTPEDGSRPGYYYINTYAPAERLRFTLEALTYHEAVPGHHLQMALDQENGTLPKFRRYGSFTAYVEGWALYSEKLGYEIGGYDDPYSRFGQLTFEMWRACRLVVDTGMHDKGWSRQQAIDYMSANTSLSSLDIEAEVDRYISWPGQALAYKIGELHMLKLRRLVEKQLGDRFDLRAFHDALLSGGAMPIDMLEGRMDRWIRQQRPSAQPGDSP